MSSAGHIAPPSLLVRTFGGLAVSAEEGRASGAAAQPRRLAILAVIARAGDRGVARGKLLSLFWPDAGEDGGRRALNQALHALRHDLGAAELFVGAPDVRLNPDVARCDVWAMEEALRAGRPEVAVAHYAGPFLEGFRLPGAPEFERWMDDERSALAHRHAEALERLARAATERGDAPAAAAWWRRRAAADPLDARIAQALMGALAAAGDAAGALRHARVYEALVGQELDLPADAAVLALARRIRAGDVAAPAAMVVPSIAPVAGDAPPAPVDAPAADEPAHPRSAVAVLRFACAGCDDAARFGDGVVEELLGALAAAGGLRVAARSACESGDAGDLLAVAARCRVGSVVEGSVRRAGDRVRVAVRLVDVATRAARWARSYERDLGAGFAAQDEIAADVAAHVAAGLSGAGEGRM